MENLVIVGTGPAGYTAAVYAARGRLDPVILAGPLPGGQLTQTTDIENFPGFEAINGFDLMERMRKQAESFGAKVKGETLKSAVLKDGGSHDLTLSSGEKISAKSLIVATGASPRWLGLESEQRLMAKGVTACATCDGAFYKDVPVVVVGGGDSAVEEAVFLTKFASKVTMIHRRDQLRASAIMAERAKGNSKIEIVWDTVVTEVLGKDEVEGVKVKNVKTEQESVIECKGYFAALGHIPATEVFKGLLDMDGQGYILLKEGSSRTSVDGVFAAGDCADHVYRQAVTAAGMGCRAAIDAERWLESKG
ncbi:MAG: thioredoxin-disulfide reductase [Victivallales bacterium]|nr:thioredoxin-disulfide reductase [Victivallales bacterium]